MQNFTEIIFQEQNIEILQSIRYLVIEIDNGMFGFVAALQQNICGHDAQYRVRMCVFVIQ